MKRLIGALLLSACLAAPAVAQDLRSAEIVVTGSRIEQDDYERDMPAVGLRRKADFLVQQVIIRGDTRDQTQRRQEIREMLRRAVQIAAREGVQLAYGDYVLTALTLDNIDEISLQNDNRPDSERLIFLVKAPLSGSETGSSAEARIARYIEAVPEVGRAQMDELGDATLSIIGPDSYRADIAKAIAADAHEMAGSIGADYAVQIEGLNMPVQWARSSPSEVLLYIPYKLLIVPQPR
ncbi:TonB-dependent receptor [Altererythrobacter xixiisoli]|uniref:TonB-dependent receptor n=1 Tax=Croceibacterium xixiisoli TaxID=1476466 RepID=A0A6I4TV19_9SPHN|nr:TonB-dependent receptor [Croceibacterium xixiisoli]MXO98607.1 TonB-dependent receptor [Croceibacterium xixiisoli]